MGTPPSAGNVHRGYVAVVPDADEAIVAAIHRRLRGGLSAAVAGLRLGHLLPALQRAANRDLIGVLKIAADG